MADIEEVLEHNLTLPQRLAARDTAREILCLACAGSGKSRTLAFRIARLIAQRADPHGIVAFTFTDKAADSIKLQVANALQAAELDPMILGAMYIGTIHSYCQKVLSEMDARYRQFEVLDENRLKLYLISRYAQLGLHQLRTARNAKYFETIREASNAWKIMNDEMVEIPRISAHDPVLSRILQTLSDNLDRDHFIDFSLMISLVVDALQRNHAGARRAVSALNHLMVDEYQDVNPAQEALIRELHRQSSTLFVVGDDDQAIYAWRGADVSNILTFRQRYPDCSTHTLYFNFRSTPAIVEAADRFAAAELGATREVKNPEAAVPLGSRDFRKIWFVTRQEEAEWAAERIHSLLGTAYHEREGPIRGLTRGDFAILMRSTRMPEQNGQPRHHSFTEALDRRGIRYTLEAGGGVFDRPQVRVLRDTFELLREGSPNRETARLHFDNFVAPVFLHADFNGFTRVLAEWGRLIHAPIGGQRRRVYPQQLVHDLLSAFGIDHSDFDASIMRDLGVFSKIIQDVEAVYLSVDTAKRFGDILNFLKHVAESGYDTGTENILRRPDEVTVSTVHKVKGLEFPVVLVVDVEARRFPKDYGGYYGWIPSAVIQPAIDRGAYQSTRGEEARLFYTAITRAERYLYVTGSINLPGGRSSRKISPFCQRLVHEEIAEDPQALPAGLTFYTPAPRIDETVMPTSFSDIKYYLCCPRDYQFRKSFGFSPPIAEMFGFGMTVHTAVGKIHELYPDNAPTGDESENITHEIFHLKHVSPSRDPENHPGPYERARDKAAEIIRNYAESYADDFSKKRAVEVRFEVPVQQAVISGSIDLLLRKDEEGNILSASVIDFKAMEGNEEPEEPYTLHWEELSLQVQLYAKAAREVLGENARTGAVHFLKNNMRVQIPITEAAVQGAVANVEWSVARILEGDFPMRPNPEKCPHCDFQALCPKRPENFVSGLIPPAIHIPGSVGVQMARAFSQFGVT